MHFECWRSIKLAIDRVDLVNKAQRGSSCASEMLCLLTGRDLEHTLRSVLSCPSPGHNSCPYTLCVHHCQLFIYLTESKNDCSTNVNVCQNTESDRDFISSVSSHTYLILPICLSRSKRHVYSSSDFKVNTIGTVDYLDSSLDKDVETQNTSNL